MHASTNLDMLKTIFKNGVTTLIKLTHISIVYMMLTGIILLLTDDGQ